MRSCRSDGLLLNPARPATATDLQFKGNAFGSSFGSVGQLWTTYSKVGSRRFDHIFAAETKNTLQLRPSTLTLDKPQRSPNQSMVAYTIQNTRSMDVSTLQVQPWSESFPITLHPLSSIHAFDLWHTAPVEYNGIAILGKSFVLFSVNKVYLQKQTSFWVFLLIVR